MTAATPRPEFSRFVPWIVVGLATVYLIVAMAPPGEADGDMRLSDAAALPVVDGGRVKPLDTYARVQLMIVSNRQDYTDGQGKTQPAVRWLLDTLALGLAIDYARVPIDDPELLDKVGLPVNNLHRYPIDEVEKSPGWVELSKKLPPAEEVTGELVRRLPRLEANACWLKVMIAQARQTKRPEVSEAIRRNLAARKALSPVVLRIENDQVLEMLGLTRRSGLRYSQEEVENAPRFEQFRERVAKLRRQREKAREEGTPFEPDLVDGKVLELAEHLNIVNGLLSLEGPLLVPPPVVKTGEAP
jgi:hypothetical protein